LTFTAIIPSLSDIAADLVISAGNEILKELSTMKNLFSILLGLALCVGCQPAGDNGGGNSGDDADANTTANVENESTTPVSIVKFSVPGMT
jgi:hypothetical protein